MKDQQRRSNQSNFNLQTLASAGRRLGDRQHGQRTIPTRQSPDIRNRKFIPPRRCNSSGTNRTALRASHPTSTPRARLGPARVKAVPQRGRVTPRPQPFLRRTTSNVRRPRQRSTRALPLRAETRGVFGELHRSRGGWERRRERRLVSR